MTNHLFTISHHFNPLSTTSALILVHSKQNSKEIFPLFSNSGQQKKPQNRGFFCLSISIAGINNRPQYIVRSIGPAPHCRYRSCHNLLWRRYCRSVFFSLSRSSRSESLVSPLIPSFMVFLAFPRPLPPSDKKNRQGNHRKHDRQHLGYCQACSRNQKLICTQPLDPCPSNSVAGKVNKQHFSCKLLSLSVPEHEQKQA